MVMIKGWQKLSLIDYAPYAASIVFLGGCNFRCGYCHNPSLVLNFVDLPTIDEKEVLSYLEQKKKWIDGVCITGGEPTLYRDLPEFITKFKNIGMKVKLDTNGTNPSMIQKVMNDVDFFAMDIKSTLDNYSKVVNVEINKDTLQKSIDLIRNSGDYEFRTTVIPGVVDKEEIQKIGQWLKGSKKYAIQNFKGGKPLVDNALRGIRSYTPSELAEMVTIAKNYFDEVILRD